MRINKKTIIALVLCVGVFFMAVGYSVLISQLKINGTANITSKWDIQITGITKGISTGSAYNIEEPTYTANTANFSVALVNPGDSMTYEVTIKNVGTLTGILNGMEITTSGTDAIVYEVTGLKEGDTIAGEKDKTLKIVAKYDSDVIADPNQRVKKLKVVLDWVQYTNQTVTEKTYKIVYDGNGNDTNSPGMGVTNCTFGTDCTLAANTFEREGYKFLGWSTLPNGVAIYTDGESVTNLTSSGKTVYLYAIWGKINEYSYNGSYHTYTVPVTGYYQLEVWGAEGGYRTSDTYSGKGGYSTGEIYLTKGTVLYIYVGGNGTNHNGYNGGGLSGCTAANGCGTTIYGGGGTDIRINSQSLYARVIVAGGGGSVGGATNLGGAGGGTTGGYAGNADGTGGYYDEVCGTNAIYCGQGGTQTAGGAGITTFTNYYTGAGNYGSFGQGGIGVFVKGTGTGSYANPNYGGAGGGGWYGGSGSVPHSTGGGNSRGGGGGSGFVLTSSTVSNVPSGYVLGSKYYMTNANTIIGTSAIPSITGDATTTIGKSGDGYARITQLKVGYAYGYGY